MHLVVPFASVLAQEVQQVLATLALPNLSKLLGRLVATERDEADERTLSPPHERAVATAWGWRGADGTWPFAARAAQADGLAVQGRAWGLVTPAHWQVGRDHVTMADPDALALAEDESRALFEATRELFESEGFEWAWGAPGRWYAAHPGLAGMRCAALDRVIGRNVDFWLDSGVREDRHSALVRRLQSEVQLLLYPHPINEAREARGELTVNSFWLSGCGLPQAADPGAVEVDATLRRALLAGDADGWTRAWEALDAGPVAELLRLAESAAASVLLTLCGERAAQRYANTPRSFWQRLRARPPQVAELLAGL